MKDKTIISATSIPEIADKLKFFFNEAKKNNLKIMSIKKGEIAENSPSGNEEQIHYYMVKIEYQHHSSDNNKMMDDDDDKQQKWISKVLNSQTYTWW